MLGLFMRDSLIYGIASIFSRSLGLLLLPFYTRILNPQDYGVLDLIMTATVFINLVIALEIGQGFARYWHEMPNKNSQISLASTAWWFALFINFVFILVSFFYYEQLNVLIFKDEKYLPILKLSCVFLSLNCLFYILLNQLKWDMRSKQYSIISVIHAIFIFTFGILFSYFNDMKLLGILQGQVVASLLSIFLCFLVLRGSIGACFSLSKLIMMLKFSIPLVPASLSIFTTLYINRLFLIKYGNLSEVGVYSAASRIASIVAVLAFGVQTALMPIIYANYKKKSTPKDISTIFHIFLGGALVITLSMSLYAQEILAVMLGSSFFGAENLISILTLALLFSQLYVFFPGIVIYKKTHWQFTISLLVACISIFLNYFLVPIYGVIGAAFAIMISYFIFLILWGFVSQILYPVYIKWRSLFVVFFVYGLITMFAYKMSVLGVSFFVLCMIKGFLILFFIGMLFFLKIIPLLRIVDFKRILRHNGF